MKRLTFPAPNRETFTTPRGWATRKWTRQGVQDVRSYGGWFGPSAEFDSRETARAANMHAEAP